MNKKPLLSVFFTTILIGGLVLAEGMSFGASFPVIIVTPTPPPTPTPAPITPTPTRNIALDYSEISRVSEGNNTRLVFSINAKYNFGGPVTIDFQNFILNIAVERGGPPPMQPGTLIYMGTANPLQTGTVTLDSDNSEVSFQLTFVFSTLQPHPFGGQIPFANYQLVYSEITASTPSLSPSPTATSSPAPTTTPEATSQSATFPANLFVLSSVGIALGAAGIMVYFKKRKR